MAGRTPPEQMVFKAHEKPFEETKLGLNRSSRVVSVGTVRTRVRNIYTKLDIRSAKECHTLMRCRLRPIRPLVRTIYTVH